MKFFNIINKTPGPSILDDFLHLRRITETEEIEVFVPKSSEIQEEYFQYDDSLTATWAKGWKILIPPLSERILLTLSAQRHPENGIRSLFKTVLKDKTIQKKKCNGETCYEYSLNKSKICIDPYEELNDDFLKLTLAGFFSESIIESHFIAIISCLLIALVFIVFSNGTISFEGSRFIRHGKLLSIFIL